MTLPPNSMHRHHVLATFSLEDVLVARIALSTKRGEKLLAALFARCTVVSLGILTFVHDVGENAEMGKTYAMQASRDDGGAGEAGRPSMMTRLAVRIAALPLSLRLVVFGIAVVHGVGLSWGMPASIAWDNDGVAPRDFLPGLASTFTPGHFYTYPPLHLAILAVLTLPVTVAAALEAGSTRVSAVLPVIIQPPYMTAMAMVARIVSLLMSLGIVVVVAKLTEEIAPEERKRHAPTFAAAVAGLGSAFTYYSHTTNLDVPYLFWGSLAALALVRGRSTAFAVYAALSIATKDQAYALFLGVAPLVFAARVGRRRVTVREALRALALAAIILLFVDGVVTNPSGFRARLAFLGGPASQDYATYEKTLGGWLKILLDVAREQRAHYSVPIVFGALYVAGFAEALRGGRRRLEAVAPLAIAVSFTLFFNLQARRVEERFTLPQTIFLAPYAGIALARLATARTFALSWAARTVVVAVLATALHGAIELDVNLLLEPRYEAEAFLRGRARTGDVVEVHGLNVYLPRVQHGPKFVRVGPTEPRTRGPVHGLEELQAPYASIADRSPSFIVVSECWVWRYLPEVFAPTPTGRIRPVTQQLNANDVDATTFYGALFAGRLPYRLAHTARFDHPLFRRRHLHASVGCPVYTFERIDVR